MPSFASWSGFTQSRIAYWPAPNTCHVADAWRTRIGIHEIDVRVVGEKLGVIGSVRRIKGNPHERERSRIFEP